MTELQSYLAGSWQRGDGSGTRQLFDPSTEEVLGSVDGAGLDLGAAMAHGRQTGGPALRAMGFQARAAALGALSKLLHGAREELLDLSMANGGNTRGDAKFDVDGATGTLAAYASLGKRLGDGGHLVDGEGIQLGRTARYWGQHIRVPKTGVAVQINAFNFPAWGMCEKLAPAILAGVPILSKPGTPSALLAGRIAQLIVESGLLPEGSFQFLAGGAGDLLDHVGPQDLLSFTGSSGTGLQLRSHPAILEHNVPVNIEADSLNVAVLGPDFDSDAECWGECLANLVQDTVQKAGQKCTAVRRLLVPESLAERIRDDLLEEYARVQVGDPREETTRMGPVASSSQLKDVRAGIEALLAGGGSLRRGGADAIAERGYFVAPTLIEFDDPSAEILTRDEVFGPVLSMASYSGDAEDAIALANAGGGGLVASLYSNDRRWTEGVVQGIAPWHGRIWIGSDKVAGQAWPPGMVMPQTVHGGPGRAGGGEELGGLRGLDFYTQRTALQGFQGMIARSFGDGIPD